MPSRGKDGHRSDIRDTKNLLKNNHKNAREPVILTKGKASPMGDGLGSCPDGAGLTSSATPPFGGLVAMTLDSRRVSQEFSRYFPAYVYSPPTIKLNVALPAEDCNLEKLYKSAEFLWQYRLTVTQHAGHGKPSHARRHSAWQCR